MKYRRFGKSELVVSEIGLGALHFGVFCDQNLTTRIVHAAIDSGVNFIDTAPIYGNGNSEKLLKSAIRGKRDKVYITTKVGLSPVTRSDGSFGVKIDKLDEKLIRETVESSLQNLGTDYIDLYQLHAFDESTSFEETHRVLAQLVQEGKIRYLGCSNYGPKELKKALKVFGRDKRCPFVALQCHFNMIERHAGTKLLPLVEANEMGLICNRALARGLLTGKYKCGVPVPEESRAKVSKRIRDLLDNDKLELIEDLGQFAKDAEMTLVQLALAWLLKIEQVTSALVGVRSVEQLEECVNSSNCEPVVNLLEKIDVIIRQRDLIEKVYLTPGVYLEK